MSKEVARYGESWSFSDYTRNGGIYGSLDDCLKAACEVLNLDFEVESFPGCLIDQIKSDCTIAIARFTKNTNISIFVYF